MAVGALSRIAGAARGAIVRRVDDAARMRYAPGDRPHRAHPAPDPVMTEPAFATDQTLLPAIAQDAASGAVLMLAHMNREAYQETLRTGRAVYYSRSRGRLWRKGESSGHHQIVKRVLIDCDGDAILLHVDQQGGAACHKGYPSCFYREITAEGPRVIAERVFDPDEVYGE